MSTRDCPCGSGDAYDACCGPLHAGTPAPTPERLMRSRYSAFVLRDEQYLLGTWHPGTVPAAFDLRERITWTGLEILDAPPVEPGAKRGVVEFVARFRDAAGPGEQHERSRFVLQSNRWWYLDGAVR